MIQPKMEPLAPKLRVEPTKETGTQNVRSRDPRLARQMQFQNSTQRNFNQRNRSAPLGPGIQRFGPPSASFASNSHLENPAVNRPTAAFNANMDDSGRQSRTASKNRSSSKDVKNRLTSKTSPKSPKSNSQKSPKSPSTASSSKSSSKSSKTSPTNNRSSPKDLKKDRYKDKESSKLSPSRSSGIVALADAEKKIKEYTIPFKKRSPSPKDKSTKSITDPKVSSTTKTAESPIKFKGSKTNPKSRNYVRRNRDESKSPIPNKDSADVVQEKTPPSPTTTSSTTSELIGSPIQPAIEPTTNVTANVGSVPFAGVGENQSFKSKDTTFVVRMVKISHIVHSLLTRLMISIGLIIDCINHRDDILNKLIVIGTGDNFFIKTFCRFFFQFNF